MDSIDKQIIKPFISVSKDVIRLESINVEFKINQLLGNGLKRATKLMDGFGKNQFVAQFDCEDTDFEITIDNNLGSKNICYVIKLWRTYVKKYYLKSGMYAQLQALEKNGKHLHFQSQTTDLAKQLVQNRAISRDISFEKSSIECSRLEFSIEVEKGFEIKGKPMEVKVRIFSTSRSHKDWLDFKVIVGVENTIEEVKHLIETQEGIPFQSQSLFCNFRFLHNHLPIHVCNIDKDNGLLLTPKVMGGRNVTETVLNQMYGQRGVICLSQPTGQSGQRIHEFKSDKNYEIESFVIELRFND